MIPIGKYYYTICTIKKDKNYHLGILLKIAQSMKANYFDEINWMPIGREISERQIRISIRFIIYPDSVMIFEDLYPYFSKNNFKRAFKTLLSASMTDEEAVFYLELNIKKDIETIYSFLDDCDKIDKIIFEDLKVPNPYKFNDEKIKKAVELIERNKIKKMTVENKEGLNKEGDEIEGTLGLIAERGIGNARISGSKGEHKKQYETKTKIKTKKIEYEDDDEFIKKANEFKEKT